MATREENLKKINEQLEKLSDDELEEISGGTNRECKELIAAMPENVRKAFFTERATISWIAENVGIEVTLHDGFFLDPRDRAGRSNVYKVIKTGKYISHEQALQEIKNKISGK